MQSNLSPNPGKYVLTNLAPSCIRISRHYTIQDMITILCDMCTLPCLGVQFLYQNRATKGCCVDTPSNAAAEHTHERVPWQVRWKEISRLQNILPEMETCLGTLEVSANDLSLSNPVAS